MRAGRLKTKRYKVRRRRRIWIAAVCLLLGALGFFYFRPEGLIPVFALPAPTLSPEESASETRTVVLPGKTWYALQLGAFEEIEPAQTLAAAYQNRGAAGYIDQTDHYRVFAAAYTSRAEAQAVQTQLGALHGVEAYVSEISRDEITLRITGQKAQLAALTDAFDALDHGAEQLYALSLSLDKREKSGAELAGALTSQKETMGALSRKLETLFGKNAPPAVAPVIQALNEMEAALTGALAASGETALGAQIKYCQILCIEAMAGYALSLSR